MALTIESTEVRSTRGGSGFYRHVVYADPYATADRIWLANRRDTSPTFGGAYDAGCASCWLGHGHTAAKHAKSVAA